MNPEVWTEEKLKKEHWRFEGVRVVPGKTYIYNNGKKFGPYRLYILDTDSFKAYEKIKDLLENDFCLNTYVTESYKITDDGIPFGFHIYWLEDWKEDDDCVNIEPNDCIAGGEFEIMIGTKATQIAGHHREHTDFYYHNVGYRDLKEIKFMIRNGLYNQLMDKLHGLLLNPNEIEKRRKIQKRDKDIFHRGREKRNNNYGDDSEARNVEIHSLTTF